MSRMKLRADRRVGLLLAGVVLLTFVAIAATVALPASDPSLRTKPRTLSSVQAHGMKIYKSEGCWYCHTTYVRRSTLDASLGKRKGAAFYASLSPSMLGDERLGPDLTNLGSRFDAAALAAYLKDPGADHPQTAMPAYAYLSSKDLEALAAYLLRK